MTRARLGPCRSCKYSHIPLDMATNPKGKGRCECRYGPPSVSVVIAPTPNGPHPLYITSFPIMDADAQFCHKFEPELKDNK